MISISTDITVGRPSGITVTSANTTPTGQQVHAVAFSDSIYNGASIADTTIPSGILWLWNGSGLTEITSQNIANGTTSGNPWKAYAVNYVAANPGKKVILVQTAQSGSKLVDDWGVGSTFRNNYDTQITACLAFLNLTEPLVLHCDAMINDERAATPLATIAAGLDSAISYHTAKFPNTPITWAVPGKDGTTTGNIIALRQLRDLLIQRQRTVPQFNIGCTFTTFEGAGLYQADNLHPVKAGIDYVAATLARWMSTSQYSKYARSIVACHDAALSQSDRNRIAAYIDAIGNSIYGYEYVYFGQQGTSNDTLIDYTLLTSPSLVNTVFIANDSITTTGVTTSYFQTGFIPSTLAVRATQSDIFNSIYTKTVRSDSSTLRVATGSATATTHFSLGQTTTGVFYRIDDATLTVYATDAKLADNSEYVALRDSSTSKALRKNGVEVNRATVSTNGFCSIRTITGNLNNNGSPAQPIDMDFRMCAAGAPSLVNFSTCYNAAKTRIDTWNT